MSFSISIPQVLGSSISQRIPWTVQVPFIVDRKFPRLEDTHLATHNLNIHIGKAHILKNVNVEIPQNKITCIIGPSGCGKTTLLRTFNRLVDSIEGVKIDGEVNLGKQDIIAALDPISSKTVEDLFVKLKEDYSIVMVTHTLRQARRIADHVIFMYLGEVIEQGDAKQIFENPQHELTRNYLSGVS